jgi:hypothetical protein
MIKLAAELANQGHLYVSDISNDLTMAVRYAIPFFDAEDGVTPESLRFFPIARSVMQKFRSAPFWGFDVQVKITSPYDKQIFFAGRDEQDMEKYFQTHGLISPDTKRTYKGFGRRKGVGE